MSTNPDPDPTRESGDDDPELAEGIIVENSTLRNATVTIHSHPHQQPVDIVTDTVNVQILVSECYLNGVSYLNPCQPLTIDNVTLTHDPRESVLSIRT